MLIRSSPLPRKTQDPEYHVVCSGWLGILLRKHLDCIITTTFRGKKPSSGLVPHVVNKSPIL